MSDNEKAEKEGRTTLSVNKATLRRLSMLSDLLSMSQDQLINAMMEEYAIANRERVETEMNRRTEELRAMVLGT